MSETWVLLRGLAREHRHWEGFDWRLAEALGVSVRCPDLAGNGPRWRTRSPTRVAGLTDDLRRELDRQGTVPPVSVLGLSLGGMVALDWSRRFPGEVARAVLVGTSTAGTCPPWRRLRPAGLGGLILRGALARDARARERLVLQWTSERRRSDADLLARWTVFARECPVTACNVLRQLVAALRFAGNGASPGVPGIVLAGGADRLVSPQCSRRLAAALGWPCEVRPDAGHDLTLDAPDWVLSRIAAAFPERT